MTRSPNVSYNLGLSIIGLAIALLLGSLNFPDNGSVGTDGKLLVGGALIASCCFGLSIALHPGWYRRRRGLNQHASEDEGIRRRMKGHHPDCTAFEKHRVLIGERAVCAGCLGIMIGSILGIVLMTVYIVVVHSSLKGSAQLLVSIGSVAIVLTYLEVAYPKRNVTLHVTLSAFLIMGFLLVAVGMLEATGSPIVGLLGVLLGFLWTNTRISLSNWRHALLCRKCGETCKSY